VIVGDGTAGVVLVETGGAPLVVVPGPTVTGVVAVKGCCALERAAFATRTAAVATIVRTKKKATGQIQSPGYQAKRRCQLEARTPTTPRFVGRRAPHSRQYSCRGS
jgi:hypothetical protein